MSIGGKTKNCNRHLVIGILGAILVLALTISACTVAKNGSKKDVSDSRSTGMLDNKNILEEINSLKAEILGLRTKNEENSKNIGKIIDYMTLHLEHSKLLQEQINIIFEYTGMMLKYIPFNYEDKLKFIELATKAELLEKNLDDYSRKIRSLNLYN